MKHTEWCIGGDKGPCNCKKEIQRYTLSGRPMVEAPHLIKYSEGEAVLYSDHLATMKGKDERIAELESALRLNLALSSDDPVLITSAEKRITHLTAALKDDERVERVADKASYSAYRNRIRSEGINDYRADILKEVNHDLLPRPCNRTVRGDVSGDCDYVSVDCL